jgi:flagellin
MIGYETDGVDDTDSSFISSGKALELMKSALKQANSIGVDTDTASAAKVSLKTAVGLNTVYAENSSGTITFNISKGKAEIYDKLTFSLHVGADADMTNKIGVDISAMTSKGLGVRGLNVVDDSGIAATYAIDAIADAVQKVSDQRSALGAIQNRLEHTIKNVDNVIENTTAAESRIRDTDMAEEMVTYSKNNILAQAGQSMLAQANQSNQGVLSLLG